MFVQTFLSTVGLLCCETCPLAGLYRKIQFLMSVISVTCGHKARPTLVVPLPYEQDQDQGVWLVSKKV